ncbi:MAG TPA: peptidyl-prolyl cis-trans isomerase, partial [Fibrobacteria bacterium]|nr:peptidyl-prolyl cis-trans isomerase [Fibrobacteria bacterium]
MQLPKSMPSPWRKSAPRIRLSRSAVPKAGLLIVVLLAACFLGACKDKNAKGTVLAQVGNSTLSLEELRESFPAEYEQLIRREQYLDFIKRWIDDEVLYQQALKAHLDDDPLVKRKLDKLMRKLLIEEFLAREGASEGFEADETTMNQYYEMHKERFRRKVPEVKYTHIRVQTLKQANELRNRVGSDNAFLAQAATHSLDPVPEALDALPFKKERELPACFAAEVAAARIGAVTAPASCPDGVYLVRVLDRQETGSTIPFAEAKEEIATTLAMQRKDKLLEARIAEYKAGTAISYNLDQIPGLAENSPAPAAAGPSDSA